MADADEAVLAVLRGRVLIATINRPEARSAVNRAAAGGLTGPGNASGRETSGCCSRA
ncbi:MAG TPA: hypothetical protein VGM79_14770 [Streptosporangiaceae bacterium]